MLAVLYPAERKTSANVFALCGKGNPLWREPLTEGYRPVITAARLGIQIGEVT